MRAAISSDDILTLIVYAFDLFSRPTFDKCNRSYEGWLYANGLLRQVRYLESRKRLSRTGARKAWVYGLTEEGRRYVVGQRDPEARWNRKWDGRWRQIIFDLPAKQHRERVALLRWLRKNDFGCLQGSVWIRPDPIREMAGFLKSFEENASAVTLVESRCAPGFSDFSMVMAAWPFEQINRAYKSYQHCAGTFMQRLDRQIHPRDLFILMQSERKAWEAAFRSDPLLPSSLCPSDYAGRIAWRDRRRLLKLIGSRLLES